MSLALVFLVSLTGCGAKEYSFAYDAGTSISSFQVTENAMAQRAGLFARDLCVTSTDVTEGASVDMSQVGSAGLFDLNDKKVLYAKNIHDRFYPASLTKVLTALVALKYGDPADMVSVSSVASGITESGAQLCGLETGDNLTLDQALHIMLMYSANDAALAIAEHIGGSVEGFADMMNEEALSLGATGSHFVNPHGLHDEDHYTTAYDLYLIFNEAQNYELFSQIIAMDSYTTTYTDRQGNPKTFECNTTNLYLQGEYSPPEGISVKGGKTGTTAAAKNCLILLSRDTSDAPYISVILHAQERGILYEDMTGLLSEIE